MVSSKWIQVESPSPFRFLAALMPPCAHTECERFTGTMEKRSTFAPISAILMTAESPARPPPMTMIFGAAIFLLPAFRIRSSLSRLHCRAGVSGLLGAGAERSKARQSCTGQDKEEGQTRDQEPLPRLLPGNDAPLR